MTLDTLTTPPDTQRQPQQLSAPRQHLPDGGEFLLWSPAQQVYGYRLIDQLFATRVIAAGKPMPMPRGQEYSPATTGNGAGLATHELMDRNNVAGLLVLHRGAVVLEQYGLGLLPNERWTSMSTVKSMTAMLVGAAVQDGSIQSLDDSVVQYVPSLQGTAYEAVTIKHLLTMSSGVQWREDYEDRSSHVNQYSRSLAQKIPGGVLQLLRQLGSDAAPGTRWQYNTGDTYLLGAVLRAATGVPIADYMSSTIWTPCGMEFDAYYTLEAEGGLEIGGSRAGMTLRDFGRFAQFVIDGGCANGQQILPTSWVADASQAAFAIPDHALAQRAALRIKAYGYSWWLDDSGGIIALGHSGQRIYVNVAQQLAVVQLAAYPEPRYAVELGFDMDANLRAYIDSAQAALSKR